MTECRFLAKAQKQQIWLLSDGVSQHVMLQHTSQHCLAKKDTEENQVWKCWASECSFFLEYYIYLNVMNAADKPGYSFPLTPFWVIENFLTSSEIIVHHWFLDTLSPWFWYLLDLFEVTYFNYMTFNLPKLLGTTLNFPSLLSVYFIKQKSFYSRTHTNFS